MFTDRSVSIAAAVVFSLLFLVTAPLMAKDVTYNYISPEELKTRIHSGASQCILDIQVQDEFNEHHIQGAVPTYAYPVKTGEEKARIDLEVARLGQDEDPIIIVCPRGGGGARRTYDYLLEKGVDSDRLYILENGQSGWPYEDLLDK